VHDVEGRQVAVLADGHFDAGCFAAKWNGTDDSGRTLSPGIYFLRLEAGRVSTTSKMVLMR
jgi:hypothetical protein